MRTQHYLGQVPAVFVAPEPDVGCPYRFWICASVSPIRANTVAPKITSAVMQQVIFISALCASELAKTGKLGRWRRSCCARLRTGF